MKSAIQAIVVTALAALILTACSTSSGISSAHDINPAVNFSGYKTYAFISEHPMIVGQTQGPLSPMLEGRLMESIRITLNGKGYNEVRNVEAASMAISFTIGSRDQIRVDSYPSSFQTGWGARGSYYGYGYNTETRVRQYTEGQLAIDVFDVASHHPAFHGTATKKISSGDRENQQAMLNDVAAAALAEFPLRGGMPGVAQ